MKLAKVPDEDFKTSLVNYPDGRFVVQFEGTPLPFRVFDKIQTVPLARLSE